MNIDQLPFPILVVAVPLVVSFLVPVVGWWRKRLCYPLVIIAVSISFLAAIKVTEMVLRQGPVHYYLGGWAPPWGIEILIDHLGAYMALLVSGISLLAVIYSKKNVVKELEERETHYYTILLLLYTGLQGIVVTGDMFNLYVFIEIASLSGYTLIAVGGGRAMVASFRYVIMGTIGACFFLIGVGYLYIVTGSLNMENLRVLLPALYANRVVQTAFIFILIGFGIKIAFFPLHTWQPDAYTYAPSTTSVIISSAMAKATAYALIRVVFSVFTVGFISGFTVILDIICWVAAIAMIFGSVYAIVQSSLKKMLAYSSVANVGYIMLGVGLSTSTTLGLTPALMHLLNHAVMKACMFMLACSFLYRAGLKDIKDFTGLGRRMPYTCFAFILAALAMIGMPPGVGFVTKWYLILAALDAGRYIFVAVIFLSTLLMIVYFWQVIEIMYIRVKEGEEAQNAGRVKVEEAPLTMLIPGLLLALACFGLGIAWISGAFSPIMDAINLRLGLGMVP